MKLPPYLNGPVTTSIPGWDGSAIPLTLIAYDRRQFNPGSFGIFQIAHPTYIASSAIERQSDYFAGRFVARQALAGLGLGHWELSTGAHREPLWPPGTIGSISHNDQFAAAVAVNQNANMGLGIGIDIESILPSESLTTLQDTVFSSRELEYLHSLQESLPPEDLQCIAFSAKESFFKASFNTVGRYFDFDALEVQHVNIGTGSIVCAVTARLAPEMPVASPVTVHFMYINEGTILTSCNLPPAATH